MNHKKVIFLCCILTAFISCGNKQGSSLIPEGSDAPPIDDSTAVVNQDKRDSADPEVIIDRVNAIYEAVASAYPEINDIAPSNDELDDAFCSSEWKTLVELINSKDAEDMGREGFFDSDYWIMAQDWGKISISDLKINVKDAVHADADLILHNLGSQTKVRLELVFERGEWFIGNFIDMTHNVDWKKNMVKHLEKKGKMKQDEAANDGIIEYEIP